MIAYDEFIQHDSLQFSIIPCAEKPEISSFLKIILEISSSPSLPANPNRKPFNQSSRPAQHIPQYTRGSTIIGECWKRKKNNIKLDGFERLKEMLPIPDQEWPALVTFIRNNNQNINLIYLTLVPNPRNCWNISYFCASSSETDRRANFMASSKWVRLISGTRSSSISIFGLAARSFSHLILASFDWRIANLQARWQISVKSAPEKLCVTLAK